MQLTQSHIERINRLWLAMSFDSKEWDESKHPRAAGQFGKGGSQSAMKSVKANIGRGRSAMNTAIAEKELFIVQCIITNLAGLILSGVILEKLKPVGKPKVLWVYLTLLNLV